MYNGSSDGIFLTMAGRREKQKVWRGPWILVNVKHSLWEAFLKKETSNCLGRIRVEFMGQTIPERLWHHRRWYKA